MGKNLLLSLTAFSLTTIGGFASEENSETVSESVQETGDVTVSETQVSETLKRSRDRVAELSHNDVVVMEKFDLFSGTLFQAYSKEKSMTASDLEEISQAIDFAAEKHRFQTRKNKEKTPYISHPIGVAYHLMEVGNVRDRAVVIGALLHDTLEDTQTTFEELQKRFGSVVADYVKEMTDDKSLSQEMRKRMQIVNASHKSKGAAQIKMADNLYNITDLLNNPPSDWSQLRIDRYFEWTQSVVDRLPPVNSPLRDAVEDAINTYWENQAKPQ